MCDSELYSIDDMATISIAIPTATILTAIPTTTIPTAIPTATPSQDDSQDLGEVTQLHDVRLSLKAGVGALPV